MRRVVEVGTRLQFLTQEINVPPTFRLNLLDVETLNQLSVNYLPSNPPLGVSYDARGRRYVGIVDVSI